MMKYAILSVGLFLGVTTQSFSQIQTKIGAHAAYGTEIENMGAGVNAEIGLMNKLSVAPSFTYFFPKDYGSLEQRMWEANANAHYYFLNTPIVGFYGLGGLNYSNVEVESDWWGNTISDSDAKLGFNVGAGTNFNIAGKITPFAELKYVISDFDQVVVAAGVRFNL